MEAQHNKKNVNIYLKAVEKLRETPELMEAHQLQQSFLRQVECLEHSLGAFNVATGDQAAAVVASAIDGPSTSKACAKCLVVPMPEEIETNQGKKNKKTSSRIQGSKP